MGKKTLKLSSLFKPTKESPKNHHHYRHRPWQLILPSCGHSKTHSFRGNDEIFKTVNSVFFDPSESTFETPESWFTNSSFESASFTTESENFCYYQDGQSLEMLVREARSERLFFEPGDTSSILEKAKENGFPFKESVMLAMESKDPYDDFRRSMEEMVESHCVRDWEGLEGMLSWYLRVNGTKNHGFIVGAFVDLLINLAVNSSYSDSSTSYSSAVSSFASSSLCLSESQNEINHEKEDTATS